MWFMPAARRLNILDRIVVGVLAIGLVCVASGLLPRSGAEDTLARVVGLLAFLGSWR
jgi:hypothetical protein